MLPKPPLGTADGTNGTGASRAAAALAHDQAGRRRTWLGGREVEAAVYDRGGLPPGAALEGPAIVEQLDTTTYLGPGDRAIVDPFGNLIVTVAQ